MVRLIEDALQIFWRHMSLITHEIVCRLNLLAISFNPLIKQSRFYSMQAMIMIYEAFYDNSS